MNDEQDMRAVLFQKQFLYGFGLGDVHGGGFAYRVVYVAIYQKNFHLVDVQGSYSNISL